MRNLIISLVVAVILCSSAFAENKTIVDFQVFVVGQYASDEVEIYGAFSAETGQYGGIEVCFYRDLESYAIRALEDVAAIARSTPGTDPEHDEKDLASILNLFVSPTLIHDGGIHLTGNSRLMDNTSKTGDPLFKITEQPFDCVVPDGGDTVLSFQPQSLGKQIKIRLVAQSRDRRRRAMEPGNIHFDALFSLINEDADRKEIRDEPCKLQFTRNDGGNATQCRHQQTFDLKGDESLLYMVSYSVDDANMREDGQVDLRLLVERWFFVNPKKYIVDPVPERVAGATYVRGNSTIETSISIDGKKRHIEAEIEHGTVVRFKWDNIELLDIDIARNWKDIVAVLTQIQNGKYLYRPPRLDGVHDTETGMVIGLLDSPENITGSVVTSTTYSRAFSIKPYQEVEIEIPLGDKSFLPFKAHETIKLKWPESSVSQN